MSKLAKIEQSVNELFDDMMDGFTTKALEEDIRALELTEQVALQRRVKDVHDLIGKLKSNMNGIHDFLRMNVIPERMVEDEIESLTVAGVGRVNLRDDVFASIPADSRDQAHEWLSENGHDGLITESVHSGTLKAFVRRQIKDGHELPEGLFKVTPYTYAVITKSK